MKLWKIDIAHKGTNKFPGVYISVAVDRLEGFPNLGHGRYCSRFNQGLNIDQFHGAKDDSVISEYFN